MGGKLRWWEDLEQEPQQQGQEEDFSMLTPEEVRRDGALWPSFDAPPFSQLPPTAGRYSNTYCLLSSPRNTQHSTGPQSTLTPHIIT